MRISRLRPTSLTARLVITAVMLVAVVTVAIGALTTLAMRASLMDRLDADVRELAPSGGPGPSGFDMRNRGPDTLSAVVSDTVSQGEVLGDEPGESESLDEEVLAELGEVPVDGETHTVDLPGLGSYRVLGTDVTLRASGEPATLVTGMPTAAVDQTLRNLIGWEIALTVLGVAVAGGAGVIVVRRQLAPLREVARTAHAVAELPLDSGEIGVTERVPDHLTDPASEVGQVGAALNGLLAHVESSLAARHRSEQQVRQFVADASHELRTPLTVIRGYTELAAKRPGDSAAATAALGKVEEESQRMTALVEDLLLLARLDSGRPLERHQVDLTRLLVEAVSDARVIAPEHRWRLVLPDREPAAVTGDESRLHQVVSNLLTNARTHTPAGTTITVTAYAGGFSVHDDGPGFPPELVAHAFERFTRADTARQRGGAGLGLSLVQAIVEAHGGGVTLESRPGDTTIRVRLPQ
ncbi:sensor histidine kinase [Nocardioides insulae]|uniref:sensor histidine kinase n=1 Tax=Nocardioides insulae TaxID=394734 RepID=UPI00040F9CED|nr:ATP-binding protein [Nocardioides insulae]